MTEMKDMLEAPAPPAVRAKRGKQRIILWIMLSMGLVVGAVFGVPWYLHAIVHESTDDAFIEGHVISVSPRVAGHVSEVLVDDNQWVEAGQVLVRLDEADSQTRKDQADAAVAAASAQLRTAERNVALLEKTVQADMDAAQAAVAVAQAAVGSAQARRAGAASALAEAQAEVASSEAKLAQAKAIVDSVDAQMTLAASDLERIGGMYQQAAASQQEMDHAVYAHAHARAMQESARQAVAAAEGELNKSRAAVQSAMDALQATDADEKQARAALVRAEATLAAAQAEPERLAMQQAQVEAARAEVDRAEAQAAQAALDLSYTRIIAPRAGRVTRKSVEPGVAVQRGQPLLAIVPQDVWVVANFKETQLTHMKPGQPVAIHVDAYPDVNFQGHVESIQAGTGSRFSLLPPENATGNYVKVVQRVPVKILFDDPATAQRHLLAPGLSVVPVVDITAEPVSESTPGASVE